MSIMWKICVFGISRSDFSRCVQINLDNKHKKQANKKINESPEHLLLIDQHGGVNATVTSWNVHADALQSDVGQCSVPCLFIATLQS